MDSNEKRILIFTSAAHYLTHFFVLVFPALVMPISRDLSLPLSEVIPLSFPMYLCYGILAIPWGYISDSIGPRKIMASGIMISGFGFLAASFSQSVLQLSVFLGVIGAGCSAYHPSGLALLSKGIKVRGRAMGINGMWGNFGIASSPLFAGILSYLLGWKGALFVFGLVGIIVGFSCFIAQFSVGTGDLQKGSRVEKREAATLFIILCAAMLFSGLMYRGYTVILPTFFESKLFDLGSFIYSTFNDSYITPDANTLIATVITSGVYLVGMVGQLIGGRVADRFDLRWAYFTFFACALPFLISLSIFKGPVLVLLAAMFILFALGMQPVENSLVAVLTPPRWRSLSYGIKFTIVFGAGSVAVHLVSMVESNFDLDMVIVFLASLLVLMLFVILILLSVSKGKDVRHVN